MKHEIIVSCSKELAFEKFVESFGNWWPKEYSWSGDLLEDIQLGNDEGEFCTEVGPHGFIIDWGRVLQMKKGKLLEFTWQISPDRVPIPDPDKSSKVTVSFSNIESGKCRIELEHHEFENHGEKAKDYEQSLNSEYGWPYILSSFQNYCK